jgi:glycerol-3-phosphate dehydrogenase
MPAPSLPTRDRDARHDALEAARFDVVVIGGGITGAGIAREATSRGLSVALVEAEDFAAGTSSRSSKLIHGGLRYLAMGDVQLVRETALERKRVHALAPHLAWPCWMVTPARSWAGLLKFRAGIGTYEKLGAVDEHDRHHTWRGDELAANEPLLRRDRFAGAVAYREYLSEDARLVLAVLRDAAARGAVVQSRLRVESMWHEGGRVRGVDARCGVTGRVVAVRGDVVVNAAGPWVETVCALDERDATPLLHLSKGIHVVLDAERLPLRHIVILGAEDKRSIFAIPRGETVYVGTTDTSYGHGADLWPAITREDVRYLLEPLPRHLDTAPIEPEEVQGAWAGLRPLIAQPGKAAREMSRRDEIRVSRAGLITIAGGKLTGFCKMAEDVVDRVGEALGRTLPAPAAAEPLPGGALPADPEAEVARLAQEAGLDTALSRRLVGLYGAESREVLALGAEPLAPGSPVRAGEVDWAVNHEAAETLVDWLYRRVRAPLYAPAGCAALLAPAAERLQALLGWSPARRDEEVAAAGARLAADRAFLDD